MKKLGILIANGSEARFYTVEQHGRQLERLELLEEYLHPRSREKDIEITSDHTGHREQRTTAGTSRGRGPKGDLSGRVFGSYPEPTDAKEAEMERFANELDEMLDHGRTTNAFDELVIFAPPHFHGLLNKHMDEHLKRLVRQHVEKDYTKVPEHELLAIIGAHL